MDYFSKSHKRGGVTIHLINEEGYPKFNIIQKYLENFRNFRKNSEIFRKIRKNSENFGTIQEKSGKEG